VDAEKAKDTIRKLLNLAANDAAAEGEIANAVAFASRLMAEHSFSQADIDQGDTAADIMAELDAAELGSAQSFCGSSKQSSWEGWAANFVCDLIGGLKCHWKRADYPRTAAGIMIGREPRVAIKFYGLAEDAALAAEVYQELRETIAAMAKLRWGGVYRGEGRSYCEGFVSALNAKLRTQKAKETAELSKMLAAPQATQGGALVVLARGQAEIVAKKRELAEKYQREKIGKLSAGRRASGRHYGGAYQSGQADGARYEATATRRRKLT
jgi:hypothetical protein